MFSRLTRGWWCGVLSCVVIVAALVSAEGKATAAPDPREIKARTDFGAGRYQQALDTFAQLYAETLHPIYLRNIGRCHQNLAQPDQAIASFRDYLRKAKSPSADDRAEVEGYIKEMEDLKKQQAAAAAPPVTPVTPVPAASPPSQGEKPPALVVQAAPAPAPVEESSPIYSRWWFWAAVAGVVAAGVGVAAAAGAFTKTGADPTCPTGDGFSCPR